MHRTRSPSVGSPALITGASSGIGAAYARSLAARGLHPILVARRADRLEDLAADLARDHGVRPTVVPADLSRSADVDRVCAHLDDAPPLGALIHAAGFGTRGHFAQVAPEKSRDMVQLHVTSAVRLTRAALPRMLEVGRGDLVYISSLAALFTTAHYVTYSATKSFLNTFAEGLAAEVTDQGLRVQSLCAGLTRTGFLDTPEYADFQYDDVPDLFWMSPEAVVDQSLRGLDQGRILHVPGLSNRLFVGAMQTPLLGRLLRALMPAQ